jgi:hypothetical protein
MRMASPGLSKEARVFFSFFLLVLFTVCVMTFLRIFMESMWPDEALYAWLAKKAFLSPQLVFSKEFVERQPPLFPLLLSLAHYCQPFFDVALRVIPVLAGVSGIIACYYAGRLIGGSDFIAAVCAIGVGLSPGFFSYLPRILSDGVMMTLFVFFILALFKAMGERSLFPHVLVGFFGICLLLLKWSGLLCLPILLICYLLQPAREVRRRSLIPVAMVLTTLALLLLNNLFQLGTVFPNLTALKGAIFTGPPWTYIQHFNLLCSFPGGPFFVGAGLLMMWKLRHPHRLLITTWFGVLFLIISLAGEKDLRYAFLFLPPAVLTIGIFFENLIQTFVRKGTLRRMVQQAFCGLFFIFAINSILFRASGADVMRTDFSYVGFREAGAYLRSWHEPCLSVLAGSTRAVRYYSGIQYEEYGGRLSDLPRTIDELREKVIKTAGTVVMVIDIWEYTQPKWADPLDIAKAAEIEKLGFRLVHVVKKRSVNPYRSNIGLIVQPVIWIYAAKGGVSCQN